MYAAVVLTSSALVDSGGKILRAVILDGNALTADVTIYNNTTGSGTKVLVLRSTTAANCIVAAGLDISCSTGIYAVINGTTPNVTIVWS